MNNNIFNNEELIEFIKKNNVIGLLLSLVPQMINIISVVSFICAMILIENINIRVVLIFIPGILLPFLAFVYSIVIRKKLFNHFSPLWIVLFVLNVVLFLFYAFGIAIFGLVFFIFSDFTGGPNIYFTR